MNSSVAPSAQSLIHSRRGAQTLMLATSSREHRDEGEQVGQLGHDDLQARRSRCSEWTLPGTRSPSSDRRKR